MKMIRQYAAVLLAAALTCSAAMIATGCGSKSTPSQDDAVYDSVYTPEVPENPISEDVPGTAQNAGIAQTVNYDNKLTVTLDRAVEIDDVNKTEYRVILCEMTVTNNSDKKIDCQTLTHFKMKIDGEINVNATRDVSAAVVARKYYAKTGSDLKSFNQEVKAGETVKGYVYVYAPTRWDSMQLIYTPYRYYSNDTIEFEIPEEKLEHYSESIG